MNEFDTEAALRAANPVDRESAASLVPPDAGDAMLREIVASGPISPLQRFRAMFGLVQSPVWGRAGFIGVVAAVVVAVVGINLATRGGDGIGEAEVLDGPAEQVVDNRATDTSVPGEPEAEVVAVTPATTTSLPVAKLPSTSDPTATSAASQTSAVAPPPDGGTPDSDTPDTVTSTTEDPSPSVSTDTFDAERDLVSLHFDHAGGRAGGHATVAAKVMVDSYGLTPWVVSGSYGTNKNEYQAESELVMRTTWGNDIGRTWVNAHADRNGSTSTTADQWQTTLEDGGSVWVAEGGQSDFTANVVRELEQRLPTVDFQASIHVVQHSSRNEQETTSSDLDYLRNTVDYVRIEDGSSSNATADLESVTPGWDRRALESQWGPAWSAAFSYLDPDESLDFSDTVALLHILDVPKSEVGSPADFADRFFG